ncbi:hypothetical protein GO755_13330 [Spirosoma sp. HMF4905]|uniref:Uncharacterized protein n=1 Tax=Spirosoma arboris TaxID=2682092 RepID=A0A7K1SBS2_9BACT|nr:hypothetical protein [Spirosoma arboris]MVM31016.1 hypothetical protein [Spirosoma arboris]
MFKATIYLLLSWVALESIQAQSQLERLLKHKDFKPVLAEHLKEVNALSKAGIPNVSVLLFKPSADTVTVYLTVMSYLIEVKENLPTSFTTVNGQPFLIYDGSELLIDDKQRWFETVKMFVGKHLCDNLKYRELLKQPGPKELRVPCNYIYDATVEKLIFNAEKLINRKIVNNIPYYLKWHN